MIYDNLLSLIIKKFFQYLGCVEVFESRGMQVCEEALKVLRVSIIIYVYLSKWRLALRWSFLSIIWIPLSEFQKKAGARSPSCVRRWTARGRGRDEGIDRRPNDRESFFLRPWSESRKGFQLYLQGWHDQAVDVSWIFGVEGVGTSELYLIVSRIVGWISTLLYDVARSRWTYRYLKIKWYVLWIYARREKESFESLIRKKINK